MPGVAEFVAPEQVDGRPVDQRSNLYSLGALYYYVLTGQPSSLDVYKRGVGQMPGTLGELVHLTADNPLQHQRAMTLAADLEQAVSYSRRLLDIRETQGILAATQLESTGEWGRIMDQVRADLDTFTREEHVLLDARDLQARDKRSTDVRVASAACIDPL